MKFASLRYARLFRAPKSATTAPEELAAPAPRKEPAAAKVAPAAGRAPGAEAGRGPAAAAAPPPAREAEAPVCRICFEGAEAGALVRPCACRGDSAHVHLACLERWARLREHAVDGWRQCGVCLTMRGPRVLPGNGALFRPKRALPH